MISKSVSLWGSRPWSKTQLSISKVVIASNDLDPELSSISSWTMDLLAQHSGVWQQLRHMGSNAGHPLGEQLSTRIQLDKLLIQLVSTSMVLC